MTGLSNRFEAMYGLPKSVALAKIRPVMVPWVQEFVRHSSFLVMATAGKEGRCDSSPRGGPPGFVQLAGDSTLFIPDTKGNKLFQSLKNIEESGQIGLLFFIPGVSDTVRINGTAAVLDGADPSIPAHVSEQSPIEPDKIRYWTRVTVSEAYGHCSRSVTAGRIWDVSAISDHVVSPPVRPRLHDE